MDLPPSKKLALMALADSADKETRVAYPGLERIMRWAGVGKSYALRLLADLARDGLVVKKSAGRKGHHAEFFVLPYGCCELHGPVIEGSTAQDPDRDVKGSTTGDPEESSGSTTSDPVAPIGSTKGSTNGSTSYRTPSVSTYLRNPSLRSGLPARDAHPRETFDDFWAAYPRKVEKRASRTAWERAVKRGADPAEITAGARRYRDDPNRIDQFTKHPPTWLNRDCWADDPLPARTDRKPTQTENSLGWLNVGREPQPAQQQLRAIEGGR